MSKVFHYINFVLIFLFLIGICILEDSMVNKALSSAQESVYELEAQLDNKDSLLDSEIVRLVDNLEYEWNENEQVLCYMVNHKSMQELGQEIADLKACINIDNLDDFKIGLQQILLCCDHYLHFMGASLDNIL